MVGLEIIGIILIFLLIIAYKINIKAKHNMQEITDRYKETIEIRQTKANNIKARFDIANEYITEQLALMGMLDMPSKNSSHSRYKNDIINRIKELENLKLNLYKEILKDGFNPTLTIMDGGETKKVKLDQAILDMQVALGNDMLLPEQEEIITKPRLRLVKEGDSE